MLRHLGVQGHVVFAAKIVTRWASRPVSSFLCSFDG